jgi:site-specific recombinase XerD
MKRKSESSESLLGLTQSFFQDYLLHTRGVSACTIRGYRDTLNLFFLFLAASKHRTIADLSLDDVQSETVLAFLNHVESKRGNTVSTRNTRLAALRSFVQHLLRQDVIRAGQYGRILAIQAKRAIHRPAAYLEPEEAKAVIAAVDTRVPAGVRDRALMLFLYNTGARVGEVIALHFRELRLNRPAQVRLLGKGRKERLCPLWPETVAALKQIIRTDIDEHVFRNARGKPLTRDGVAYLLNKYVHRAAKTKPQLLTRRVTPHVMRHSCAVALLQAGVDVTVIRDYLGHASIATTNRYVKSNLRMKREVLEAFWNRAGLTAEPRRRWSPSPKLLAFLNAL